MKNFNSCSSHGQHGSKRRELAQHTHSRGSHSFTHTLTSTQLQRLCAKRQPSYYIISTESFFFVKVPEGGGTNWSILKKYQTIIIMTKIYEASKIALDALTDL